MEAVVFCGIQGSGKSTFYRERFFDTHVRINLDMLRTRRRERVLLEACVAMGQAFVADNTNPTPEDRRRYVDPALAAGYRAVAYWFDVTPRVAIARNKGREECQQIPVRGIIGTYKRLRPPTREEGFAAVYRVNPAADGGFAVEVFEPPALADAETRPIRTLPNGR